MSGRGIRQVATDGVEESLLRMHQLIFASCSDSRNSWRLLDPEFRDHRGYAYVRVNMIRIS